MPPTADYRTPDALAKQSFDVLQNSMLHYASWPCPKTPVLSVPLGSANGEGLDDR